MQDFSTIRVRTLKGSALAYEYRASHVFVDWVLGFVDLDLECSTILLRQWNPTQVFEDMGRPVANI